MERTPGWQAGGSGGWEDSPSSILRSHLLPRGHSADEARVDRIASEALTSFRALADTRRAVSVFGSARADPVKRWGALAEEIAAALVRADFAVITGGGPGLMETANRSAAHSQGHSIGLTIRLPSGEEPNPYLGLRVPFRYFFLRKLAFVKYACAFVCLPGGFGTLDELFEALNLKRTHVIDPFPVILMGSEYWAGLLDWLRASAVGAGALSEKDLEALEVIDDPKKVVSRVRDCHDGLCRALGIHR